MVVPPRFGRAFGAFALALLLAACEGLGGGARLPPTVDNAERLAQRGDNAAAAREYAALAEENPGTAGNDFRLRAARQWLLAGRAVEAEQQLAGLVGELPPPAALERRMLGADLALLRGDAPRAWTELAAIPAPAAGPAAELYHEIRQRIAFATGRPVQGVESQIVRERLATGDQQRLQSRRELYAQLRDAATRGLKLEPQATRDAVVRGWLELGPIAALAARGSGAGPALASWQARYPRHPAADLVRQALGGGAAASGPLLASGSHVAVLLPLTGRTAAQAAQVRDGLLTGLYSMPAGTRPVLRFYDTGSMPVAEALDAAQAADAQFVIGPLTREEVLAAADYGARRPPLLALNFLPGDRPAPERFLQFALSPEDEAREIARRALAQGQRRAVALVPAGDWGQRVLAAFTEELTAGGGVVLSSATYTGGAVDLSAPIQQVLRLSDSRARHRRLESVLGTTLQFQPRRRADIDFLFVPAPAGTARQLRPQLRFFFAGDLPAYATSDAFEPNPKANQDLDGLIFPDMPWVLSGSGAAGRLRAASREAWGEGAAPRGKLYAFGYDAWQIYVALQSRGFEGAGSVDGATGRLTLQAEQQRLRRSLEWAQIRDGSPRVLTDAP